MEDLILKLREKFATSSTETLKKYYEDIKMGNIPTSLSEFSKLGEEKILKYLEDELRLRGVIKKAKRVEIK
ncbi:MAG: hypothetical protein QXD25_02235 [Nanopusillaceae archaeon]